MANTVRLKRSAVPGRVPTTTDLALGELAINTHDGKLYTLKDNGAQSVVDLSAGGAVTSVAGKTGAVTLTPADVPGTQSYHGFVVPYEVSLTYNKTTRQVTITPSGATFDVWVLGVKYTKTGAQTSTAHTNASGDYFLYYNAAGNLEWSDTAWDMKAVSPVAYVYYDTIPADGYALFELHTYKRNPEWHESQHFAIGTFVRTGLEISGYTLNADGNTAVTFQVAAGTIVDEDIEYSISTLADNGPYTILRRSGASGYTWDSANTVPYLSGATWISYNQNNGGTWQMTEGANSRWVNYYLYATTAIDATKRLFMVPGQAIHSSLSAAQGEGNASLDLTGLGLSEFVCVWKLTFATGNAYTATGKARLVEVNRITNTRGALSVNLSTTNHSLLTGRDTVDSHPASAITNTPSGNIAAIDVQSAINELDTEKLPNTTSLTEIGAALVDADEIPVYDTSAAGNRKSLLSRIWTYISGKLASPPAIGGTTPAAGTFTTLGATGNVTLGDASGDTVAIQAGTAALPTLIPNGDPNTGLWFPAADTIAASTAGSERLRIDSSGNVGIGTNAPGYALDVLGSSSTSIRVQCSDPSLSSGLIVQDSSTNTISLRINGSGAPIAPSVGQLRVTSGLAFALSHAGVERMYMDESGNFAFRQNSNSANTSVSLNTTVQNALTLDVNGRLGIGLTDPARLFHVRGNAATWRLDRDANSPGLQLHRFPTGDYTTPWKGFFIGMWADGVNDGRFYIGDYGTAISGAATERFAVSNTGNIFIYQPAPVAINASATLTVANLQANIITATSSTAVNCPLPTGTLMDGWYAGSTDMAVDWVVINLGSSSGAFTVQAGTSHTVVGNMVVAINTSGRFRSRRTTTNTWVTYRIG